MSEIVSGIAYVRGDATEPCADGARVIAHVCNDTDLWVANMIGRYGVGTPGANAPALDRLAGQVIELGASVHMPRIGCGLAGGTWPHVEPLIAGRLVRRGIAVAVYDHGEGGP
ncbi:hypothetical protein IF655_27490 [Streptomyces sp. DSM 110735]|uniref:hypothetical protein n=1 Tax=Streptomyces sp. DSM 110735 TaxID=2775031 RepID=UPI0018F4EC65|nr:hypothetical protein [Streptomyces sp. DSM 110735]MBJ7907031.1 hypothetical protein [Streptomyces sp. DSM 110735]